MKFQRYTEIMRIKRVPVYAHWSLLLVGALILIGAVERPAETLALWGSFFGLILLHECGHMIVAQRMKYEVTAIRLFPIHGCVWHEQPWSRYEDALIAWGGVAAQAVVAVPLIAFTAIFGFTRFPALNAAIGVLGYYSAAVAVFNLLPAAWLDGSKAWYVVPELIKRWRKPPAKARRTGWRGW